jgi:tetratricopeptide (TPR) repeat protein
MLAWLSRVVLAFALLAAALGLTSAASAQGNPLIERGVAEYEDLRFQEALQTFSAALVRSGNTTDDQIRIYRYLALNYLALQREEEASGAYRALLGLNPDEQPGTDISPRFREFFNRVRAAWEAEGRPGTATVAAAAVAIQHRSPPQAERGTPVTLTASVTDPDSRVASLVLAYRQGTSAVYRRVDCTQAPDGSFTATIAAADVSPPLVEYYFEAIDAGGLPLASRGDVAAPLRIAVPAPGGDIASEPAFWGVLGGGVVLVGVAVALGVFFGTQGGGQQQGTLMITIGD